MDSKAESTNKITYEDFQPITNLLTEERNTLEIHLPDFRKDQVRVQLDNQGNMRISGERPLEGNKWSRFRVNYRVPKDCNSSDIHAKFNDNVLQVILPKKTIKSTILDNPTQTQGPHTSPKTPSEPKPDKMNEQITGGIEDNKTKDESTGLEKKKIMTKNTANDNSQESSPGNYQVALGGYVIALHKPRRVLVNIAVVVAVMVAAGAYAVYRVRSSSGKDEWSYY
ncbi:Hsp20-like chaperones superfamily protein [Thalictrum thalictroides]|uniref:Hsp20-like chaperones superfamily protein n=1 Tax=Thalictrum thalictroides TaxID=46969 RepID=A0A7J6X1A8_THATH|nr:Hsp20-like chaperones superfamily protein [Thalictrum thalictroides]